MQKLKIVEPRLTKVYLAMLVRQGRPGLGWMVWFGEWAATKSSAMLLPRNKFCHLYLHQNTDRQQAPSTTATSTEDRNLASNLSSCSLLQVPALRVSPKEILQSLAKQRQQLKWKTCHLCELSVNFMWKSGKLFTVDFYLWWKSKQKQNDVKRKLKLNSVCQKVTRKPTNRLTQI